MGLMVQYMHSDRCSQ